MESSSDQRAEENDTESVGLSGYCGRFSCLSMQLPSLSNKYILRERESNCHYYAFLIMQLLMTKDLNDPTEHNLLFSESSAEEDDEPVQKKRNQKI